MDKIPLIVVCGPTASGKTKIAVELAKMYNGEVVSADLDQKANKDASNSYRKA